MRMQFETSKEVIRTTMEIMAEEQGFVKENGICRYIVMKGLLKSWI